MVCADKNEIFTTSPAKAPSGGDASGLARLATLVPKVRLCPDAAENNRRNRIRSSMVSIVDWVCKHPEQCPDLWVSITGGDILKGSGAGAADTIDGTNSNAFDKPTFGKVHSNDLAKWLCNLSDGPSRNLVDLIDSQDGAAVKDIFTALLQLRSSDRIPMEARKDVRVAYRMLEGRMEAVGPRLPGWFQKSVSGKGEVDWSKVPIFKPVFTEGRMTSVKHIGGDVAEIPAHVIITADYALQNPHDDMGAKMVKAPAEYLVAAFFEEGKGPKKHALDKKNRSLQAIADKCHRELQEELSRKRDLPPDDKDILQSRNKNMREAALAQTRAQLERAPKKSRTIEFST